MTRDEEQRLVRRILRGEQAAFEILVENYQRRIYGAALRATRSEQDALDLSQEIFLKIYRGLSGFRFQSSLATWIYHITSTTCIDFLRAQHSRPAVESLSPAPERDTPERELPDDRWDPEAAVQRQAAQEALNAALRRLSDEHREILLLREMGGLSYEEIAARLSLPPGTVKSRIARARAALRELLRESGNFFESLPSNPAKTNGKEGGSSHV